MNIGIEELNNAAMQIILFAGNSRTSLNEALCGLESNVDSTEIDMKMKSARDYIVKAHKIQTDMIQSTIEDDTLQTTLLFTHAQDTLMTIYSELNMANHLIKIFRKLEEKVTI